MGGSRDGAVNGALWSPIVIGRPLEKKYRPAAETVAGDGYEGGMFAGVALLSERGGDRVGTLMVRGPTSRLVRCAHGGLNLEPGADYITLEAIRPFLDE